MLRAVLLWPALIPDLTCDFTFLCKWASCFSECVLAECPFVPITTDGMAIELQACFAFSTSWRSTPWVVFSA